MAGQRNNYSKRSHSEGDYADNSEGKRRKSGDERDQYAPEPGDTVYRYLCPGKRIGSILGRGGEIVKQLRSETRSKIRVGESVPGCDERVITVFSSNERTNVLRDTNDHVCPAQDALFRIFDRLLSDEAGSDSEVERVDIQVTVRLLLPSDQVGCVIGKGGQVIEAMRNETGAQIRILKNEKLPGCAMDKDELLQISGDAVVVKKALYEISCRLRDNPSKSQQLLTSTTSHSYQSGSQLNATDASGPYIGITPYFGHFGAYRSDIYQGSRDERSAKQFSLRFVCPTANIGSVIGKGGVIINQIRQESGAIIKVDSSSEDDDCVISISAKEYFEDPFSPTMEAAIRLLHRCSEKIEKDSGEPLYSTRVLVPSSRIGGLIGKGGSIISEMRQLSRANIRVHTKENLPKVASTDEDMVQISGEIDVVKNALMQVMSRLKVLLFEKDGILPVYPSFPTYFAMPREVSDEPRYGGRDSKSHGRDYSSYPNVHGSSSDVRRSDSNGSYNRSRSSGSNGSHAYGGHSSRRSGLSEQNPASHGRDHDY